MKLEHAKAQKADAREHARDLLNIRDLADAFSMQAKYCNKAWLALIAAASLVLYPNVEQNNVSVVKLPFSLGSVPAEAYKVIGFIILTILTLSYCQAYAGAHIATRFAHERIQRINSESERIEARKFYNLLIIGTFLRVSYLVQHTSTPRLSAIYYCILKLVASAVTFGIPIAALGATFVEIATTASIPKSIFWAIFLALCIASITVFQALWLEVRHVFRLAPLYWTGELPDFGTGDAPQSSKQA